MVGIGRIAKAAGRLIFMDPKFTETAEKALKASYKAKGYNGFHKQIGTAFKEAELATKNESFWGGLKKLVTDIPKDFKSGWARKGAWAKFKGVGGTLMKRLPLLFVAMEIPNIYSAFKDEGLVGGITEIFKSGIKCAGSMAGFIVGGALTPWCPLVGGFVGCMVTDWLLSKVVGKSHSEKKAEMEEALTQADGAEQQAQLLQQQLGQPQLMNNPYAQNMFATNPYGQGNFNVPQATMTPQQVMAMQQMLQSGYGLPNGNYMDQDFMAMASGMNRMNYLC